MTGPSSFDAIREMEDRFQVPTYAHLPLAVVRGEGCRVFDSEGNPWLDFYGGHAVALTGHSHPRVVAAVREQAGRLLFYSNIVYNDARARAAKALVEFGPGGAGKVFLCNSGAEANEAALKTARTATGRPGVVAMSDGFHGRTLGALSATGLGKYRDYGGPLVPGSAFVPFGDLAAAEAAVGPDTAAVLLEPVPSLGGVRVASPEYYRGLRRLCDERGALLLFDEVQTGLGRTGRAWAGDHWGVRPDMHTMAKGVASGVPCGAVLFSERIAAGVKEGDHGSTFGGGPLACAALEATLAVIREEGLVARAAASGAAIREGALALPGVREVRGLGLLLAISCEAPAKAVLARLRERRVLASSVSSDPSAVRLLPPLTAGPAEVEEFLEALAAARPDQP
ncbi:MAG: aminotransferase class III-fold pyridoxal phosphate-dependent enzyme [Planctomycetes bacterium]|nr:aminotransferase class III-fold pyridoxal phosphate-dependent enzyme [Planctomycetota bacterium]